VNGSTIHTNGGLDWTPNNVEYFGEVFDHQDQMPGDMLDTVNFGGIKVLKNGTWANVTVTGCATGDSNARYSFTSSNFQIWDARYLDEY
jgi:hypothetical protein